jgi:hypothetical protein
MVFNRSCFKIYSEELVERIFCGQSKARLDAGPFLSDKEQLVYLSSVFLPMLA